jgi:hypothetical protein
MIALVVASIGLFMAIAALVLTIVNACRGGAS